MKRMLESLTGNYTASASVVDGTLIISLPDAISPVVWRLELGQAKASALEVTASEGGIYTLQLKTPRGSVNDIASFSARGRAVAALMAVSRAMEQSHGQVYPAANDTEPYNPALLPVPTRKRKKQGAAASKNKWGALAAIIVILVVGNIFISMTPKRIKMASDSRSVAAEAPKETSGVPVSADDFLKNH